MKKTIMSIAAALLIAAPCAAEMEIIFQKAKTFQKEGQYAEAVKLYGNYLEKYPASKEAATAQYNTGVCYQKLKRDDEAAAAFGAVTANYPESNKAPDAYLKLGAIAAKQKKYEDALKSYRIVIDKYSDSPKAADAQLAVAATYEKTRDIVTAKKEYQKVIDNYPDSKKSDKAREKLAKLNGQKIEKKPRRAPSRIKKAEKAEGSMPSRAVRKKPAVSEADSAENEE